MATDWQQPLDPGETLDYRAELAAGDKPVLEAGETIASFTLAPTAEAVMYGLEIQSNAPYAPALAEAATAIDMWIKVDEAEQDSEAFISGIKLGIEVTVVTTSVPPRTRQRTFNVEVKQL